MVKLYLKFGDRVIQEVLLSDGVVTIGRHPDNLLRIDNPAVSGHHAKVYREGNRYVLEDTESFNGTYVNNHRIRKVILKDGDQALIGKHTIQFADQGSEYASAQHRTLACSGAKRLQVENANPPQLDCTVVLDTAKAKELFAKAAAAASAAESGVQTIRVAESPSPRQHIPGVRQSMGTLSIVKGRTDRKYYVLTSKLTVIGKSKMAGIRLRKWFAPRVAASIHRAEDSYFIAPSGNKVKIRVNDSEVRSGQKQLKAGDVIELADIKAVFDIYEG
jgi:pSer/pThr/pTyr-binding forkhead associated (FHA) protein